MESAILMNRMWRDWVKINKCYSYMQICETAKASGRRFSVIKSFIFTAVFVALLLFICIFYRLKIMSIIFLIAFSIFMIPIMLLHFYKQKKEEKRFNDIDIYLHQMAYSFQRYPKINVALEDTAKVLNKNMRKVVNSALDVLNNSTSDNVYKEALEIIEKEYNCQRINTLHRFLISIEERGGSYYNSLNVLIDDFDRWVKRIYKHQKDMSYIKKNIFIGIILSYILASSSILISSILDNTSGINLNIHDELLYQLVSALFIFANICFLVAVQVCGSKEWINGKRDDDIISRDLETVFGNMKKSVKIFCIVTGAVGIVTATILIKSVNFFAGIVAVIVTIYLIAVPWINKKEAFKRLREDVYLSFPDWLRDVVINLYEVPLQVAIESTYDTCPAVLKKSLSDFIKKLEIMPTDVRPYYEFCSEFQILDITSTVKTLYSLSEMEPESMDKVLNTLIKRNYEIVDKHEKIKNEDSAGILKFGEYIPMIFVSIKIGIDMLLVITNYL